MLYIHIYIYIYIYIYTHTYEYVYLPIYLIKSKLPTCPPPCMHACTHEITRVRTYVHNCTTRSRMYIRVSVMIRETWTLEGVTVVGTGRSSKVACVGSAFKRKGLPGL